MKKEAPKKLKGFQDILDEKYYTYQGFFEKAQEVAVYYGFRPIELPTIELEEVFLRGVGEHTDIGEKEMYSFRAPKSRDRVALRPEGTASVMRAYVEQGMQSLPQPVMIYYYGSFFRHDKPQRGRFREFKSFGAEILGTPKSIADAIIIQLTKIILEEAGMKNVIVDINSIGDKESRKEYIRELTGYYRKHINKLGPKDRQRIKTNPLRILDSKDPKTIEINENAPESVSYLSSISKKHFKEVLEYLEEMKIPYRLNKNLVRGLDYYTDTVFEIKEEENQNDDENSEPPLTVAGGGRYDHLATALGHRRDIPSVGMSIGVDRVIMNDCCGHLQPRIIKPAKVYFIQLGQDAKLKSLNVIEELRKAKISIRHSLSKDSLSAQLGIAERLNIPKVIILGQKEAIDNTVIVRNMENHSQKTVKIDELVNYLKKS